MVEQIAVFLENKPGRLQDFCKVLYAAGVDMKTLSIADTNDFGIVRVITNDNEKAVKALRDGGFTATVNTLVCVEVPDRPGGLAELLELLDSSGTSIEYLYSAAHTNDKRTVILFRAEDNKSAAELLKKHNVKLLNGI